MSGPREAGTSPSLRALQRKIEDYERWFRSLDEQMRVLERERQKLSAVLNHTDAGFLVLDAGLKVLWTNEHFTRQFARRRNSGDLLGADCHQVLCGHAEACAACPAARPFRSGTVAHHEMRLDLAGRTRHIYASAMPIRSPSGEIDQTILMLQDVTDLEVLKTSGEALRASEARFRSIFDNAASGVATVGVDGRFLQVNPALCRFLGYEEPELIGLSVYEITHPADRPESKQLIAEGIREERKHLTVEKRYLRKDGATVWGLTSAAWLHDEEGRPAYSVALVQDVTERRLAEEALRREQSIGQMIQEVAVAANEADDVRDAMGRCLAGC